MTSSFPTLSPLPNRPLVSVIVPNYNHAEFLEETILSILNQDYDALELLVMDGGSTDDSLGILHRYDDDPRIHWVSEPDFGPMDATLKGLELAKGELIAFIASNDTYVPGAIKAMVEELTSDPQLAFVGGWFQGVDIHGNEHPQRRFLRKDMVDIPLNEIVTNDRLPHISASIFRRDLARKAVVPEMNRRVGDTVFTVHYMLEATRRGGRIRALPKVFNHTRIHDNPRGMDINVTLADRVEINAGFKRLGKSYKDILSRQQVRAMRRYAYLGEIRFRMHAFHRSVSVVPLLVGYIWSGGWRHVILYLAKRLKLLNDKT